MEDEWPAYREFLMEMKVPGGKLARLRIGPDGTVRLSGDFFIYPGEGLFIIEKALSGLRGDEPLESVESAIEAVIAESQIQLVGLDVPVIARLYRGTVDVESHKP